MATEHWRFGNLKIIAYTRVSTEEQGQSGASLDAQRAAIEAECDRRGWNLLAVAEYVGCSGKDLNRPGVRGVLDALQRGEADALEA